ncbi:helix-turn-helix transcriptional regulator [Enterocloster sp.]|uniref:helix-turn-helix transcriptional regulator n=1 Tax=Enterocloster sp. TaxID=2719315 RepID=UPI003AB550DB
MKNRTKSDTGGVVECKEIKGYNILRGDLMAEKRVKRTSGKQKWKEWSENEDNQRVLSAWSRAGMTDEEIARQIGISRSTLIEWKKKYPQISKALSDGKDFADRLVEDSLYKKAMGFYVFEQKAFKVKNIEYDENGKKISEKEELQTAEERHYIEPDIKAIIFWLKNRKPEIWKEKIEENSVDEEGSGVLILTPSQVEEIRKEVKDE